MKKKLINQGKPRPIFITFFFVVLAFSVGVYLSHTWTVSQLEFECEKLDKPIELNSNQFDCTKVKHHPNVYFI